MAAKGQSCLSHSIRPQEESEEMLRGPGEGSVELVEIQLDLGEVETPETLLEGSQERMEENLETQGPFSSACPHAIG